MKGKIQSLNAIFSIVLVCSLFLNSIPVQAQDIVTSEDISGGGSSVFVFRKSRAASQQKFAARAVVKRNSAQKAQSRKVVKEQVAKVTPPRQKAPKVDPVAQSNSNKGNTNKGNGNTNGRNTNSNANSNVKVVSKEDASNAMAGSAEVYLEKGQIDKATTYFLESLKLNPNNEAAKQGLSEVYTRKGDDAFDTGGAESAFKFYELAVKYNPNNAAALTGLGEAYEDQENDGLAIASYEKALAINPNLTELYAPVGISYYQRGEIAKADDLLTKATTNRADDDQTQFYLGLIRHKQNRNEEAIVLFKKSIELNEKAKTVNNIAESHYFLGEVYDRLDRDKDAIGEYTKAVAINRNYHEAWFDLGVANYNRKRYEDAVNSFKEAVRIKNDNYEYHENLGDVYRQLKQYPNAEGSYGLAVTWAERETKNPPNKTAFADLYSKYGFVLGYQSKWNSAIDALNKAVALSPDTVDYTNLGWAYYNAAQIDLEEKGKADKLKNTTESQKYDANAKVKLENGRNVLQKAAAIDPNFVAPFMNLGMTLTELGDHQGAITALKRCIQLRDKWYFAYNELGYVYQVKGDFDEAIKNFRKATDIEKNYVTGLYNLAYTLMQKGDSKEARKIQDRLRKIDANKANLLEAQWLNPGNMIKQKVDSKNPLNKIRIPY